MRNSIDDNDHVKGIKRQHISRRKDDGPTTKNTWKHARRAAQAKTEIERSTTRLDDAQFVHVHGQEPPHERAVDLRVGKRKQSQEAVSTGIEPKTALDNDASRNKEA